MDITISRQAAADHGEYRAHVAGHAEIGRLTWRAAGDVRVADHTLVPSAIGGRGVAARLVEALIADAREQHFRILPACSYVAVAFDRHPEWTDLRATALT